MSNLITVQYVRDTFPTVDLSQFSDVTISGMISTASTLTQNFIEFNPALTSVSNEKADGVINDDMSLIIFPRRRPIESLTSLQLVKGGSTIDLSLSDGAGNATYDIPTTKDRIVYPNRSLNFTSVSILRSFADLRVTDFYTLIDYQGGYDPIPADMQYAVALYTLDQVTKGQNATGAEMIRQGGITIKYGGTSSGDDGKSDNVRDAENILRHYKRVSGF